MNVRIKYLLSTIILLCIEIVIALYVHDNIIRPYIGDVLVVIVIYTFIRIWIPGRFRLLPLSIFIFAVIVEVMQYIHIVERLGLSDNRFMSVLIGGTFDWKDIMCYGVGCIFLLILEMKNNK